MPEAPRPVFDSYALPLPERREGPAAALSFGVHVAIALLVLWRGAALFASGGGSGAGPRGGGGGGGRPAVSWFALPAAPASQAQAVAPPQAPVVTVPTAAAPVVEPVKLDLPPPTVAFTPPTAVGTGDGTTGGPGQGPGSGGGTGTGAGTGTGSDAGPGSGGNASDIIAPTPVWAIIPPSGAPPETHGKRHEVRFWVTAEGTVTRVEVTPPIKDGGYRRDFLEKMKGYLFKPATRDGRRVDYVATVTVYP
jgi:hypothetical protein